MTATMSLDLSGLERFREGAEQESDGEKVLPLPVRPIDNGLRILAFDQSLANTGWAIAEGEAVAPGGEMGVRDRWSDVVLAPRLRDRDRHQSAGRHLLRDHLRRELQRRGAGDVDRDAGGGSHFRAMERRPHGHRTAVHDHHDRSDDGSRHLCAIVHRRPAGAPDDSCPRRAHCRTARCHRPSTACRVSAMFCRHI